MLTALFVFAMSVTGFGQETTGSLEGTVKDSSGALVPGATVVIQGNAFRRSVQTNEEGNYRVLAVPPGSYNITASAANFATSEPTPRLFHSVKLHRLISVYRRRVSARPFK